MFLKVPVHIISAILFILLSIALSFADIAAPYEVGTWAHFCEGAVSHTFDDNTIQQTGEGQKAFDEKGFPMTLFLNTGNVRDWSRYKSAFKKGHEIASHNQQHNSDPSGLKPSQKAIQDNIPGEKCVSIAYPNCSTPGDKEVLESYIAGRNCNGQTESSSPSNFAQIGSKMFGAGQCNCPNDASSLNSFADQAVQKKGWSVFCHHGIGSDGHSWAVTNLGAMKNHLRYLDENRDKIWCETFGNVARYIQERNNVAIFEKSPAKNSFTMKITDNLNDDIFNYPLSIRRPLPDGWNAENMIIMQGKTPVTFKVVTEGSNKFIMFEAIPDAGDVLFSSGKSSVRDGVRKSGTIDNRTIQIQKNGVVINTRDFHDTKITVMFLNLTGVVLASHTLGNTSGTIEIPLTREMSQLTLLVKVSTGCSSYTRMVIPQL